MSCSPRPLVVACLLSLLVLCSSAPTQEASKAADAAAPPADANVEVLDHETKVELVDHLTLPHAPHRPVAAIVVPKQQPGADSRFMAVRSEQTVQPPANNGAPLLNSLVAHSSMSQLAQTADAKYTAAMAQESIQREAEDRLDMVRRERQLTHDLATNRLHDARAQTMEERRRLAAEERRERLKLMRDERELSLLKEEQAKRETSARQALSDLRGMNRAEHIVRAHDRFSQEEQNFQRRFKVQESVSEKQYEEKRDMARKNRWAMRMRRLAQMNEEQLRLMSAKRANFIRSAMKNATAIQTAQYLAQAAVKDEADIASKLLTVSQVLGELIRDRNDVREELHTAERERAHIVEILSALNADLQSKERIHSMAKSDLQRAHAEISEAQFRAESEETGTQAKVSAAMDIMIAIKAARPIQQSVLQTEKTVIEAKERIGNTRRDLALADDQIDELKPKVARYTAEVRRAKEVLQQLQSKFEWAKMREQQAEAAVRLVAGDAASGMQREFLDTMIKSRNKVRQQIEHQRRKLARQNLIQTKRWEHLRRASRNMQATRVDALKKQLLTAEHDTAISRNEALTLSSKIKHDAKATLNRDLAMRSGSADKLRAEEQTKLQEADVEMKRLKSEMAKKHEANEKEVDSYKKQAAEIKRAQRDREQREKAKEKELEEEENMEMAERKKELTVLKESHEKLLDSLKNKHTKQMMEEKEHEEKELFRLQYGPTPGSQEWLDQLKKQQEAKLKDVTKKLQHEKDQVADAKQKALDEEAEALLRKEAELTGDHDKLVDFMKKKSADYEIEARQAAAKLQDDEKVQGRRDKANVDVVNKIEQAAIKNHVNVIRSLDKAIDEAKKDKDTTEFKVFLKHTKDLVQQMAERDVMSEQQHRRLVKLLKQYHREHMRNMALRDHEDRRFKQQNDDEQDVWKEDHDAKEELLGYLKHLFKIHDNEWKDRNWQANNFLVKSRAREWFSNHAVQRMNRHHRFVKNIQGKYMQWVSELPCGVGMKNCLQKQPEPADETVPSYRPVENDAAEKKVDNVLNEAQDALSHAEDDAARFRETRSDSTLSSSAEPALLQSNEVKADSSLSSASSELDALSGADTEIQQWMSNVLQTGADGVAAL